MTLEEAMASVAYGCEPWLIDDEGLCPVARISPAAGLPGSAALRYLRQGDGARHEPPM